MTFGSALDYETAMADVSRKKSGDSRRISLLGDRYCISVPSQIFWNEAIQSKNRCSRWSKFLRLTVSAETSGFLCH